LNTSGSQISLDLFGKGLKGNLRRKNAIEEEFWRGRSRIRQKKYGFF
jgi:hypothetical protein